MVTHCAGGFLGVFGGQVGRECWCLGGNSVNADFTFSYQIVKRLLSMIRLLPA
jgi:hypothetical protein